MEKLCQQRRVLKQLDSAAFRALWPFDVIGQIHLVSPAAERAEARREGKDVLRAEEAYAISN